MTTIKKKRPFFFECEREESPESTLKYECQLDDLKSKLSITYEQSSGKFLAIASSPEADQTSTSYYDEQGRAIVNETRGTYTIGDESPHAVYTKTTFSYDTHTSGTKVVTTNTYSHMNENSWWERRKKEAKALFDGDSLPDHNADNYEHIVEFRKPDSLGNALEMYDHDSKSVLNITYEYWPQ